MQPTALFNLFVLYYWFSRNRTNTSRVPHILHDKSRFISIHGSRSYYGKFHGSHAKFRPNHALRINPLLPSRLLPPCLVTLLTESKISDNLSLMIQNLTSIAIVQWSQVLQTWTGPSVKRIFTAVNWSCIVKMTFRLYDASTYLVKGYRNSSVEKNMYLRK